MHRRARLAGLALSAWLLLGCREDPTAAGGSSPGAGGAGAAEGGGPVDSGGGGASGLGGAGGAGLGGAAPGLRLLSWNLEGFPKSSETVGLVAAVIGEAAPDVVGVEEVESASAWQALDEALPEYTSLLATSGDGFVRVGALVRTSRVSVSDVRTLFEGDAYAFPRPMLALHVVPTDDASHDFTLGVVHLKAQLDQASADRRRDACTKLNQWVLDEQATGLDQDVVVAGDFNDELTDPPEWNVFGPLLTAPDGGFLTLPLEQAGGYTYVPFTSFLDHVHVRGAALGASSSAVVLPLDETIDGYVDRVSDHRPVLATLRF